MSEIPDEWDNIDDDDKQIVNNLVNLEINNGAKQPQDRIIEIKEPEFQSKETVDKPEDEEEPLLLINFTKWSYNKIKWVNGTIENQDLFERLMKKLNQEDQFFTTMTDDLLERELAFHTTNKQWKSDIKQLEELHKGDYFSCVSYPPVVGGFLLESIWEKIKERTEWQSVNILKCIYLAKTNRSLLYKHNMALAIEFMALEQKLLGPTAKRLKDEEDAEDAIVQKQYQDMMQKRYENEINEGIIKNLQQAIYTSEGISNNLDRINSNKINELDDDNNERNNNQDDEDNEYYSDGDNGDEDGTGSYCSTCDGRNSGDDEDNGEDDETENIDNNNQEEDETTTSTSFIESDEDEADNELDEEDNRKKKKEQLIEERKIKEIESERQHKENQRKKEEQPPPKTLNVLDKIIAMVFSKLTVGSNKELHYKNLARLESSIKESWIEEFGCLPPNCLWREDANN